MGIEVLISILAGVISISFGGTFKFVEKYLEPVFDRYRRNHPDTAISKFLNEMFDFESDKEKTYKQRIESSLENLKSAAGDIDKVVEDLGKISLEKQKTIESLEQELITLESRESEMKGRIESLEKVPIEALQHFEEILAKGDKRGAKRDYLLFISGVVLTTIIAIILAKFL